jgi:hypothetical protein
MNDIGLFFSLFLKKEEKFGYMYLHQESPLVDLHRLNFSIYHITSSFTRVGLHPQAWSHRDEILLMG